MHSCRMMREPRTVRWRASLSDSGERSPAQIRSKPPVSSAHRRPQALGSYLISVRSVVRVYPGPLRGTGLPRLVLRDSPGFRLAPISGFVSVLVSIGPVIGPIQGGRFRHSLKARTADRASYQGFTRVLAGIRFNLHLNGVQGVAGSNPAVPTWDKVYSLRALDALGEFLCFGGCTT